MRAQLCIDEAIGETRRLLIDENGRPVRLAIDRWSWANTRARFDEVYLGRCVARDPAGGGWFVDIGFGPDGFLSGRDLNLTEGQSVAVRVKSEAQQEKGPALSRASISLAQSKTKAPARIAAADPLAAWRDIEISDTITGRDAQDAVDGALDELLDVWAPIAGGGRLSIEPTRAFVAVDVDAAGRASKGDMRRFRRDLNLAAADEIGRQIALRALGGLIVVDFAHMEARDDRDAVAKALEVSLKAYGGRRVDVAPLSRFCVCEASVSRTIRPLQQAYVSEEGAEAAALAALRRLEDAARAKGGRPIELTASPLVANWLTTESIAWRAALTDRIGPRFSIVEDAGMTDDAFDVRSL